MGDLLIRNLDDAVLVDLQRRAEANHTSPEEEARRRLESTSPTEADTFDREAWLEDVRALREEIGPSSGPSSTDLLHQLRYGDPRQ